MYACGGGESAPATPNAPNSPNTPSASVGFDAFQQQVLTPSCATANCHVSPSPQGGLNLSEGVSYTSLVNITPANATGANDGLKRVMPGKPDSSLLYHKLVFPPGHHVHDYGNVMPVGTGGVSAGQLEWVRQWIMAGAPRSTSVADGALLADRAVQTTQPFLPLTAPAAGAGYQLKVDKFDVNANFERELFVYRKVGNTQDVFVNRIETSMRPFSHHFVLYTFNSSVPALLVPQYDQVRDIRMTDGTMNFANMLAMGYHVFTGGSMTPQSDYVFPSGTALRIPANSAIDLNVHYANKTSAVVPGEAYVNLYTVPQAQVQHVLSTLNLSNTNLSLPANQVTIATKDFTFSAATTIIALTSHMHARGTKFEIWTVGANGVLGSKVYESTDWEHPAMVTYAQPLVLQAGARLRSIVTYNNTTSKPIFFGLTSDDEMDIIFGYFY
jgi:hypothetical protein